MLPSDWIPAFAGMTDAFAVMTGGPSESPFRMTPAPNPEFFIDKQASHSIIN
jgi:hypothetical protein